MYIFDAVMRVWICSMPVGVYSTEINIYLTNNILQSAAIDNANYTTREHATDFDYRKEMTTESHLCLFSVFIVLELDHLLDARPFIKMFAWSRQDIGRRIRQT